MLSVAASAAFTLKQRKATMLLSSGGGQGLGARRGLYHIVLADFPRLLEASEIPHLPHMRAPCRAVLSANKINKPSIEALSGGSIAALASDLVMSRCSR